MLKDIPHKRILKFASVGAMGAVINLAFLYLIREYFGIYYVFAGFLSSQIALTCNFIANDAWTFEGKKKLPFLTRFGRYWLISHGTILLDLLILYILTSYFALYYVFSMLIAILISASINYVLNRKHTFH
jgi:dolichol-phosphate mannosyltransferase